MKCLSKLLKLWLLLNHISFSCKRKFRTNAFTNIVYMHLSSDIYRNLNHPSASKFIYKAPTTVYTYIVLIVWYLHTLTRLSVSNLSIVRVVSWIVLPGSNSYVFIILVQYFLSKHSPRAGIGLFELVQTVFWISFHLKKDKV